VSTKNAANSPAPITFGRDRWEELTGLPITSANDLVALGLIRSLKVGRRRLFLYADLGELFKKLAARGENLKPRKLRDERKANRSGGRTR
jgi:hypothetical protein